MTYRPQLRFCRVCRRFSAGVHFAAKCSLHRGIRQERTGPARRCYKRLGHATIEPQHRWANPEFDLPLRLSSNERTFGHGCSLGFEGYQGRSPWL